MSPPGCSLAAPSRPPDGNGRQYLSRCIKARRPGAYDKLIAVAASFVHRPIDLTGTNMGIASAVEWSYERVAGIELARCDFCSGRQLKPHFHDTHQIAVLLSGRRRFRVAGRTFDLEAGEILFIPAMVPHVGGIGRF